jgi:hypothetical protein
VNNFPLPVMNDITYKQDRNIVVHLLPTSRIAQHFTRSSDDNCLGDLILGSLLNNQ